MCFIGLNIDWGGDAETILSRGDNDEYWRKELYRNEASQYYFHIWKEFGALGDEPSYPKFVFHEREEDMGGFQINKVHMEIRLYKSEPNFVDPSTVGYTNSQWYDMGSYYLLHNSWREKTADIEALNGNGGLGDFMYVSDSLFAVSDFEPLDKGIELVFGDKASVGLICSFADSLQEGKGIPGRCCLDAPYQTSAPWGQPYSCDDPCGNDGPTLGGLDEGACNAYGGTFCRNPSSCDVLQACVEEYTQAAIDQELYSYQQFLEDSPEISDPTSFKECGNAREYFGYDKDFLDDERVCDDVWQMRMTDDFDFLDEFYNQGSDGGVDGSCGTFAECNLISPDAEDEFADVIKNGKKWRSINFGIEQLVLLLCCNSLDPRGAFGGVMTTWQVFWASFPAASLAQISILKNLKSSSSVLVQIALLRVCPDAQVKGSTNRSILRTLSLAVPSPVIVTTRVVSPGTTSLEAILTFVSTLPGQSSSMLNSNPVSTNLSISVLSGINTISLFSEKPNSALS